MTFDSGVHPLCVLSAPFVFEITLEVFLSFLILPAASNWLFQTHVHTLACTMSQTIIKMIIWICCAVLFTYLGWWEEQWVGERFAGWGIVQRCHTVCVYSFWIVRIAPANCLAYPKESIRWESCRRCVQCSLRDQVRSILQTNNNISELGMEISPMMFEISIRLGVYCARLQDNNQAYEWHILEPEVWSSRKMRSSHCKFHGNWCIL